MTSQPFEVPQERIDELQAAVSNSGYTVFVKKAVAEEAPVEMDEVKAYEAEIRKANEALKAKFEQGNTALLEK